MQILLGAVLVFAVLWFVALKPKTPVEEPIAAQTAPTEAPATAAGGETANSAVGKTIESANNAAATANSAAANSSAQTGEEEPSANASSSDPSAAAASNNAANAPAANPDTAETAKKAAAAKKAAKSKTNAAQAKANAVIRSIQRDLKARRAAVVLVYTAKGKEDKVLRQRIKSEINRRKGKVRTYYIRSSQVGYYDGLLAGLNLSQTPSTIVIAPDNQAKVLGGITSAARIDRLTSSAIQTPAPTTP